MSTVIKVENLGKQYRLGTVGTGSFAHDLNRVWHRLRGKDDPYLSVGEENDRTVKGASDYVWALRNVNFGVKHGEVLGIIGRNGAGKSTLLKVLSRTTSPTTGSIKIKGRVASLLEVGTGFHPELSGRDNVFLNGAILGMSKQEIKMKFDEIVDFAGVERYIDTPVKRYSSGMYVRLAFAVAAHLDPEILVVDEVLAVGDAEFQRKALGKMKDVSRGEGRTVLFVSHNMTAIKNLCHNTLILEQGSVLEYGRTQVVANQYLALSSRTGAMQVDFDTANAPGNEKVRVKSMKIVPLRQRDDEPVTIRTPIDVEFEFWNFATDISINLSMHVYTQNEECVFNVGTESKLLSAGLHKGVCKIPSYLLNDGIYTITMMLVGNSSYALYNFDEGLTLEINEERAKSGWSGKWPGIVRPQMPFSLDRCYD